MPLDTRIAGIDDLHIPGGSAELARDFYLDRGPPVGGLAEFARRSAHTIDTHDLSVSLRSQGRCCGVGRVLDLWDGGMLVESDTNLELAQTVGFQLAGPDFRYAGLAAAAHRQDGSIGLHFVSWEGGSAGRSVRALVAARLRGDQLGARRAGQLAMRAPAWDARKHRRAAVSGLSAVIEGWPGATARRRRVLNVGEGGMLVDGLARRVGAQVSFVLAGRGIDHAGCGRVAHRSGKAAGIAVDHWHDATQAIRSLVSGETELVSRAEAYTTDLVGSSEMPVGESQHAEQPPGSRDRKPRASNSASVTHSRPGLSPPTAHTYLNCPRCGLTIAWTVRCRPLVHCPRCLGRTRTPVELFASTQRAEQSYAGAAPRADAERNANGATSDDRDPIGHADLEWRSSGALRDSGTGDRGAPLPTSRARLLVPSRGQTRPRGLLANTKRRVRP